MVEQDAFATVPRHQRKCSASADHAHGVNDLVDQ